MHREDHIIDDIFCYRYAGPNPTHALLIFHGVGGHGAIYDRFCAHYANQGAEVWTFDAPGHGRTSPDKPRGTFTLAEWIEAGQRVGAHIAETSGLPVFTKGSSLGVAAAYCALSADQFTGGILMGHAVPSGPTLAGIVPVAGAEAVQQLLAIFGRTLRLDINLLIDFDEDYGFRGAGDEKKRDPHNTWSYDLAAWLSIMTYEPEVALSDNTKPILFTVGENDPLAPPAQVTAVEEATSGPTELYIHPDGVHQLMLYSTVEYSEVIRNWIDRTLDAA